MSVDKIVLFGSVKDGTIQPWQSAWFSQFEGNDTNVVDMENRRDFDQDLFGLKTMLNENRMVTIESGMEHSQYCNDISFIEN